MAVAGSAAAGVDLSSQARSVGVTWSGAAKGGSTTDFLEWSELALVFKSGGTGYWNSASQFSSFDPDNVGTVFANGGSTSSMYAEGATRSERNGTFTPAVNWTATTSFKVSFTVGAIGEFMNIFWSADQTGSGSVVATLKTGSTTVWQSDGTIHNENVMKTLSAGTSYTLEVVASSTLLTNGNGGDSQYNIGVGFETVPGPSALAMIAVSAFLRRRRT